MSGIKAHNYYMLRKPKKPSLFCKQGHRKSGHNLITRIRDGKKILECRTCANASLQARREAGKRNAKIMDNVIDEITDLMEENPDAMENMMKKDFARWDKEIAKSKKKGEEG
jgi:hypothetical protein